MSLLKKEASHFAKAESSHDESVLYGVTDGKAVGTYIELKFQDFLLEKYDHIFGSSAKGIDFPSLNVDQKTTSIKQPQSSCPFRSARQKIYGLGYHLLVFVYEKSDDHKIKSARLDIQHTIFVNASRTADFQTTTGLLKIIENNGNSDDIVGFFHERNLPLDEIQMEDLAEEVLKNTPVEGFLTISNALQWRLQYGRVIAIAEIRKG